MRLWSIHPEYLDVKGLVAAWREGLLAQKVLRGMTKGYKRHPQLTRFKNSSNAIGAIGSYLKGIIDEADKRGYHFNSSKIVNQTDKDTIPVTTGQVEYEFKHLLGKLRERAPERYEQFKNLKDIQVHPLFITISGAVEGWERTQPAGG
ncbi:MAG: pyrimidine dimer DNA glycosylase/endonuclease V [Proteobacteria bacterium]|nr:pyrimidine dimer DNA glycosylase/endonuclease V [Pseudomonadota bacterium]